VTAPGSGPRRNRAAGAAVLAGGLLVAAGSALDAYAARTLAGTVVFAALAAGAIAGAVLIVVYGTGKGRS
jgi:hypothetical protein